MDNNLNVCLQVDYRTIYEFSQKMDEQTMVESANHIEKLLISHGATSDKIQNVFELFIETVQNILNYAYNSKMVKNHKKEVLCTFSLSYFTKENLYILESCNLIEAEQKQIIEEKINSIQNLDEASLRKLIRKKSRSKVANHEDGAGLGYIMMRRKSTSSIEIEFIPYKKDILKYKQRLTI